MKAAITFTPFKWLPFVRFRLNVKDALFAYDEEKRVATFYRLGLPMEIDNGTTRYTGPVAIKANLTRKQVRKVKAGPVTWNKLGAGNV